MKYLVNRETKEHVRYHEYCSLPLAGWDIVEADSEGWIPWDWRKGGESPLPDKARFWVRLCGGYGASRDGSASTNWAKGTSVIAYRPIIAEQSDPVVKDCLTTDIFTRLRTAIDASEQIPAIIDEINAQLPKGYRVIHSKVQS